MAVNRQQEWIDRHPITWAAICAIGDFMVLVVKVRLILALLELFGW